MNAPQPPTQLGRYRIVKVLGRGAMGVVYEGLDPRLERPVAIKTILKGHLLEETLADEYSARFVREAQAAARLSHPNIVTVFDFGEQGEVAYLVMEFIRGRELAHAFDSGERFALSQALRIMAELLEALDYAHAQGVVHRDVKPANVMIDAGGRVKLTDFGVARLADAGQDRTVPGTMVGTPSYMSPEQIQGLAVGSRADLFAAGVILYQFLTGQRPFAGAGPFAVHKQIVHDDAMPPTRHNSALPAVLDAIVARALAKSPDDRFESAAAFAAALRTVPLPASVPPPTSAVTADVADDPDATVIRSPVPIRSPAPSAANSTAASPAPPLALVRIPSPPLASVRVPAPAAPSAPDGLRWRTVAAIGGLLCALGVAGWFVVGPRPAADRATPAPAPIRAKPPPDSAATAVVPPPLPPTVEASLPPPWPVAPASAAAVPTKKKLAPSPMVARAVPPSAPPPPLRCDDLRARLQLGEPMSPDSQSYFDKECKR